MAGAATVSAGNCGVTKKTEMAKNLILLIALLSLLTAFPNVFGADLEDGFRNPPDPAKPWVYWINMDGHFTKEGAQLKRKTIVERKSYNSRITSTGVEIVS